MGKARSVGAYVGKLVFTPVHFLGEPIVGQAMHDEGINIHLPEVADYYELLEVLAHEVVHLVHPEMPEGAVAARGVWLSRRPAFRGVAETVAGMGLFKVLRSRTRMATVLLSEEVEKLCRSESTTKARAKG